jgi:hypothetical protein
MATNTNSSMQFIRIARNQRILRITKADWQAWKKTAAGRRPNRFTRTIVCYEMEMTGEMHGNRVFLDPIGTQTHQDDLSDTALGQFIRQTLASNPNEMTFTLGGAKTETVDESSGDGWNEPPDSRISSVKSDIWIETASGQKIPVPNQFEKEVRRKLNWYETTSYTVDPDEE